MRQNIEIKLIIIDEWHIFKKLINGVSKYTVVKSEPAKKQFNNGPAPKDKRKARYK